jgi:uncharacterized integral membrane protein
MINRRNDRRSGPPWSLIGAGVLGVVAIAFLLMNKQDVRVHLLVTSIVVPLWLALLGSMMLGAVIAALYLWWRARRR